MAPPKFTGYGLTGLAKMRKVIPQNFPVLARVQIQGPHVFAQKSRETDFYPVQVLGGVVLSLWGWQTAAQYWIKVLHAWVQKLYPILGLGSGGKLLRHFQTPVLHWINLRVPSSTPTPKTRLTQTMVWVFPPRKLRPWSEFLPSLGKCRVWRDLSLGLSFAQTMVWASCREVRNTGVGVEEWAPKISVCEKLVPREFLSCMYWFCAGGGVLCNSKVAQKWLQASRAFFEAIF